MARSGNAGIGARTRSAGRLRVHPRLPRAPAVTRASDVLLRKTRLSEHDSTRSRLRRPRFPPSPPSPLDRSQDVAFDRSRCAGGAWRWSPQARCRNGRPAAQAQAAQKIDQEYTAQIKKSLSDPRISTELVDHLPASATVPTPLKFLGHIVGAPGILDHAADIHRYLEAVAKAAPKRAKFWKIGKTEEGRDMVHARDRRRSDDRESRQVQGLPESAHRSAQDDRSAGAADHQDGEADLLDHRAACTRRSRAVPRC